MRIEQHKSKGTPHLPSLFGEAVFHEERVSVFKPSKGGSRAAPKSACCGTWVGCGAQIAVGRMDSSPVRAEGTRSSRAHRGFGWWYLLLVCALVVLLFLATLPSSSSAGCPPATDASGGGSSRMDVRRSPKQTMHVSAMPCEGM